MRSSPYYFPRRGFWIFVVANRPPALRIHRQEWGLTPWTPYMNQPGDVGGTPILCTGTAFPCFRASGRQSGLHITPWEGPKPDHTAEMG